MAKYPNDWYTEGLLLQKPEVVQAIFNEFLPLVTKFIRENSGTTEDAKDVFMYAIEVIYLKIQDNKLVLTASFFTYLFEICKRRWLNELRKNKFSSEVTIDSDKVSNMTTDAEDGAFSPQSERQKLMSEKFTGIPKDCQMLLSLSWNTEMSMEEIAVAMGWTYAYARKRKHLCKESLIMAVKSDIRYTELRA